MRFCINATPNDDEYWRQLSVPEKQESIRLAESDKLQEIDRGRKYAINALRKEVVNQIGALSEDVDTYWLAEEEPLEILKSFSNTNTDFMRQREQYWIDQIQPRLNNARALGL